MKYTNKLYLTEVELEVEGDIIFPEINMDEWKLLSEEAYEADEKNKHNYTFKIFQRK
jgi:dihydrofolate reductase